MAIGQSATIVTVTATVTGARATTHTTNGGCGYRTNGVVATTAHRGVIITMITTGEIGTIGVIN